MAARQMRFISAEKALRLGIVILLLACGWLARSLKTRLDVGVHDQQDDDGQQGADP